MKIPPKSLYARKDPGSSQPPTHPDGKEGIDESRDTDSEGKEDKKNESLSPYDIENTLEKLDHDDRKWLLFQLVLCDPIFLEEVMMGFPMSLVGEEDGDDVADDDNRGEIEKEGFGTIEEYEGTCESGEGHVDNESNPLCEMTDLSLGTRGGFVEMIEGERKSRKDEKKTKEITEKEKERDRLARKNPGKATLLPILVHESEWLLTYCQIDAIPSSTRDTFLLNLFLISPLHFPVLRTFYSSLESGRRNQEMYETYSYKKKWKKAFRKANKGRKVLATAAMGVQYGCVGYWEELAKEREGVWDVALSEIGGLLMRDLPGPNELDKVKSPEVDHSIGKQTDTKAYQEGSFIGDENAQDRVNKGDKPEYHHTQERCIAQDHIKMMAFIIQTKTLSLFRQLIQPDSASDFWSGRYRYKALTISDMVKLSVLLTRSPLPMRKLLHDEIRSISAEIVILFDELESAECEWVRVDDELGWDLECIQRGLDDVGYGYLWEGVMATWYENSV